MRLDNTLFATQNAELSKEPRYVITIDFDGTVLYLTSHDDIANIPAPKIDNVIAGISATSQTLNPDRANATIGSMNFNIVDLAFAFTNKVRTELDTNDVGLRGRTVQFFIGYKSDQQGAGILDGGSTDDDPDFDNFVLFQTQIIDRVTTKEGIYTVHCSDIQRDTKKQLFELALTYLTASISEADTTIPCLDVSGFEGNFHGTSYTDAPSANVIYIKLDRTKEIIRCPVSGISGNSFTGVTRGVFGTKAQAIEVDPASASDRRPKVEEYIYLELPAVKLEYALLTGVIWGTANVLPSGWHAGVPESFVRSSDFTNIGADLWDTTDDSEGVVLRFDGIEKQDAKRMIETEINLLLGLFSPVYSDGQLGLKRMVPSLPDSPVSFFVNDGNVKSHGDLIHDMNATQNNLRVDWNWNGDRFLRSTVVADSGSIARHKVADEKRLQFRGLVGSRFTEQVIRQLLTSLRDMYTAPPLRLDVQGFHLLNPVEVGDAGKVQLSSLRDYTQPGASLDRTMTVHGMSVDWLGGVKLRLFGSAERADEIPPVTATTCMPDAFYSSEGASLSATPGLMTGNATNSGTFTLVGAADMNAPASIFYWDNDLTISVDTTLLIEGNVQLRVKGFLTINGNIDGIGSGIPASVDDGYTAAQHYYWAADRPLGVSGFIGNSMAHMGLLFRYPDDGGIPDWVWATRKAPLTEGLHQAFPNLILAVSETGSGSITGIPTDMRGGSGSFGSPAGEKTGLSGRSFQRAVGGAGGAGGAALCVVCRGGDFGVAGQIMLDGDNSVEPTAFYAEQGGDYDIYGGSGGAGCPGALLWLLDGSAVQFPDLAGHFQAKTGVTPAQYALPPVEGRFNQSLSENNRPRKNMASFDPNFDISDFDQTGVNFRIQFLPCDITPEDDQAVILEPPTNIVITGVLEGVAIEWTNPADVNVVAVEVWGANEGDRTKAVKVNSNLLGRVLDSIDYKARTERSYWLRSRDADGNVSLWEPNTISSIYTGGPLTERKNWITDPEFDLGDPDPNWLGNGNGSQTPFWRANILVSGPTATHQAAAGEDGGVAIDLDQKNDAGKKLELQSKKKTAYRIKNENFLVTVKYKTIGSVDALDHDNFSVGLITSADEFGGTQSTWYETPFTIVRSSAWTTFQTIAKTPLSEFQNFVSIAVGFRGDQGTADVLRIDSVQMELLGNSFGDLSVGGNQKAGLVPEATAAQSGLFLKGDGAWGTPTGSGVDSFNGRTGVVVPVQADYDSFFLTPAEGDAAYSMLGHVHSVTSLSDTLISGPASGHFLALAGGSWQNRMMAASDLPVHSAGLLTSGAVPDPQISVSSVTQHQAALGAEASTVSTLVRRNSAGDINARLFKSEYDSTNATIGFIMTQIDTASNNFIRPSTPAQLSTALQTAGLAPKASPTFTGMVTAAKIAMADNLLERPYIDDYAILHQTVTGIASTTINYSSGQSVRLALGAANVTTLTLSAWPATGRKGVLEILVTQGATPRTVAWPAAVNWPDGVPPDLATANGRFLIYLTTVDGGTNIDGTYTPALS